MTLVLAKEQRDRIFEAFYEGICPDVESMLFDEDAMELLHSLLQRELEDLENERPEIRSLNQVAMLKVSSLHSEFKKAVLNLGTSYPSIKSTDIITKYLLLMSVYRGFDAAKDEVACRIEKIIKEKKKSISHKLWNYLLFKKSF